jgi:serine/threonine protein kinase
VKESKLLNGRYRKIKKLGQGSYNVVYLAEDMLPEGKKRMLAQQHLEMIAKIPEKIINPYR